MEKKSEYASSNAPGVCEKLFNALSIGPVIRPLRSLTFRQQQQQQDPLRADTDTEDRATASVTRLQAAGKVDIEYVPELLTQEQPKQTKDINDKVDDYINQMKIKFHRSSHYLP